MEIPPKSIPKWTEIQSSQLGIHHILFPWKRRKKENNIKIVHFISCSSAQTHSPVNFVPKLHFTLSSFCLYMLLDNRTIALKANKTIYPPLHFLFSKQNNYFFISKLTNRVGAKPMYNQSIKSIKKVKTNYAKALI